ncbi:hypothetical protein [Azospirillum sp.]|uniref:hypothetical protein n=1 Tax=Azospirillum sp. TaxID=34012 RepID=UPI002D5A9E53|nr:hypothetical protein [Azospirillum sp.]HYD68422.1 hypothetical protein [Azospirillum sp.]
MPEASNHAAGAAPAAIDACEECPWPLISLQGAEVPFPFGAAKNLGEPKIGEFEVSPASQVQQVRLVLISTPVPSLIIVALGQFPSSGWTDAWLVPEVNVAPPADGIYNLTLVAGKKPGPDTLALTYRIAVSQWPAFPSELKGIRVKSANNEVVEMLMR